MTMNNLNIPWIESPFFYELLKKKKTSKHLKKIAIDMHENGYSVINLNLSNALINNINFDIDHALKKGSIKKNPAIFHYNKNPRIVEAWKFSKNVSKLATNTNIFRILKYISDFYIFFKNDRKFKVIHVFLFNILRLFKAILISFKNI